MKSIYSYTSATEYLLEAFQAAKKTTPGLTAEKYADRLGLGRSTFKMILSGKRNLTLSHALSISSSLKLSPAETDYLHSIILKGKAKVSREIKYYAKKIKQAKQNAKIDTILVSNKEILADPYAFPILVYLTEFCEKSPFPSTASEIKKLAELLSIPFDRVQTAIHILLKKGVIKKRESGKEIHYVFDKLTNSLSQREYLKSWLVESAAKIDSRFQDPKSFFNASTFSLYEEDLPSLIQDLKSVLEKYMGVGDQNQKKGLLMQAGVQLFPLLDASSVRS